MKALNREVPWRDIVRQGGATLQKYVESARKEHEQWMTWSLIRPLSREEAREVLKDPVLGARVRSRACCRDKSQGQGELRAKTRVVVLGHRDPDLTVINRDAPIPTRLTEQVLLPVYMSGRNRKLLRNKRLWRLVRRRDDSARFLQGQQDQGELPNRLFMMPPRDPILSQAGTCPADMYERERVWPRERPRTMVVGGGKAHYDQEGVVDCIALVFVVYVDDFLVIYAETFDLDTITGLLRWGSTTTDRDVITFKERYSAQPTGTLSTSSRSPRRSISDPSPGKDTRQRAANSRKRSYKSSAHAVAPSSGFNKESSGAHWP